MDPLCLSAWTCFLSTLQSAVVALFLLPDRSAWKIHSLFELSCYVFAVSATPFQKQRNMRLLNFLANSRADSS